MGKYLFFGGGVLLGALAGLTVGFAVNRRIIKTLRGRIRALRNGLDEPQKLETMKKIVWACVLNGFAWIWCSYILAAMDKMQIAETLSTAAVTQIIGVVLAYAIKSIVENLSKHNHWPDKRPAEETAMEPEETGDAQG